MLRVTSVTKKLDGFQLGPLDFEVGKEVLSVLGENGAGKTTLLNVIAGIIDPDYGSIYFDDMKFDGIPIERRHIGYLLQKPYLFPHMNVHENILYGLRNGRGAEVEDKVSEVVSLLGIDSLTGRRVQDLSGGEEQKVALARILVTDPNIVLMDEPLSKLDSMTRRRLRLEFKELFTSLSVPVIYVTHDPREALELADRVIILRSGKVVEAGGVEVLKNPTTEYTRELLGGV